MNENPPLTFETDDKLGLKPFCEKLEQFLMVEHDFVEGSLVLSLNAPFGAGKTMFLSMWKSNLDKRREKEPAVPKGLTINAWESDYCGDPLLSIVNGLIKSVSSGESTAPPGSVDQFREAAKDVGWFLTGFANSLASHWTGLNPVEAGELAEDKKAGRRTRVPDFITLYEERTKAFSKLKDKLREVFGGESPKALVFIDELDRCRPDYAISYLETIKHVFDVHGLVFVLAIDYDQLESSAKSLFGEKLKFSDYFRKFSHRTISLPEPNDSNLHMLAFSYVKKYLEKEGKRTSMLNVNDRIKDIVHLIIALKMPPRQIQEMFRIIGHMLIAVDPKHRGQLYWCIGVGTILMSALKVAGSPMYQLIGSGEATHLEVGRYLIKLLGKKTADWWFYVYVSGADNSNYQEPTSFQKLFEELGLVESGSQFNARKLGEFAQGWGHNWQKIWWKMIYDKIEAANTI